MLLLGASLTGIFFSYSSKDCDRVAVAHKALTERGFDVFWDLQVPAGFGAGAKMYFTPVNNRFTVMGG